MKLLLLAGTTEARVLAGRLAETDWQVTASLSGATRAPKRYPVPTRTGGFGGEQGFAAYLAQERPDAILDATHPFAARITARTARMAEEAGIPCAHLIRPAWRPGEGDEWHIVNTASEAIQAIPKAATVFLSLGAQHIAEFSSLRAAKAYCRRLDPAPEPPPIANAEWIIGPPEPDAAAEQVLFRSLRVDWLVTRNSGGDAARGKLEAARMLNIRVVMLARPAEPSGVIVRNTDEAMDWLANLK